MVTCINPQTELLRIKVQEELDAHDQNEVTDVETAWTHIKNTIKTASEEILGSEQGRKQEDWFRENEAVIKEILERKQNALQAILRHPNDLSKADAFKTIKHTTQQKLRKIKDLWWKDKAKEIQSYADQHDYRNFFQAIKTVYGPSRRKLCPIEDNNGNLIKEEEGIRSRWREHYSNILNHETTANHDILQVIPQYPCFNDLDKPVVDYRNQDSCQPT